VIATPSERHDPPTAGTTRSGRAGSYRGPWHTVRCPESDCWGGPRSSMTSEAGTSSRPASDRPFSGTSRWLTAGSPARSCSRCSGRIGRRRRRAGTFAPCSRSSRGSRSWSVSSANARGCDGRWRATTPPSSPRTANVAGTTSGGWSRVSCSRASPRRVRRSSSRGFRSSVPPSRTLGGLRACGSPTPYSRAGERSAGVAPSW
jgi:hypothetical protein